MTNSSLLRQLASRAESGNPLRVGVIGAGKFGTMFLAQARRITGLHILGIADLNVRRITESLERAEWHQNSYSANNFEQALATHTTHITDDPISLIEAEGLEVLVEATGSPVAGAQYALRAINAGLHIVMVNVEADVLVGPLLAQRARSAGVTYSLAYGDQPALICELVDWAWLCGFEVVCAGKGTKYLPAYRTSTPDTVWDHYGFSQEKIQKGGFNPRMFNSFLDGTKSAIEMAAVSNATGLIPAPGGLEFPPCGIKDLPNVCKPHQDGGTLSHKGTVEVVSSLNRDGSPVPDDLRWGVFVTFEAPGDYVAQCFSEYGLVTDSTGNYTTMYRPYHLVGLELAISVISAGLNAGPTGSPLGLRADVVATAKRDLAEGEELDGEGGNCVYGSLKRVETGTGMEGFPIGLAHKVKLKNKVSAGSQLLWSDVTYDPNNPIVGMRLKMQDNYGIA